LIRQEAVRQFCDGLLRNADDHYVARARSVLDCRRGNAGLGGQRGERFWPARVGDPNLVSERREAPRENAANLTRADDSNVHGLSLRAGRDVEMVGARELRCGRRAGSFC
jgi:hypothetical protein